MKYMPFGTCGFDISLLGFGAGHIGGNDLTESEVSKLLNTAVDLGITLFDTARSYGLSEDRIGKYLIARRKEIIISTKVGYGIHGIPDWTFDAVRLGIEEALVKLRTEYIDIIHLHSCSIEILKRGDVIDALDKAKESGKIRAVCYSGENEALEYAANVGRFGGLECSVSLFDQINIDRVLPVAMQNNLGIIAKRPLGNVPWKFLEQPYGNYCEEYWKRMKKMNLKLETDWLETAIRFSAYTEGVCCIIIGSASIEHIKENIKLLEKGKLAKGMYSEIRTRFIKNNDMWTGQI